VGKDILAPHAWDDVAPTALKFHHSSFYKYAAPTALSNECRIEALLANSRREKVKIWEFFGRAGGFPHD
jgi:hypothetical protein